MPATTKTIINDGPIMSNNSLFKPFTLGNLRLKNRIVMAPITRNLAVILV